MQLSEWQIRLSRVLLSPPSGSTSREHGTVLWVYSCRQCLVDEGHAANDSRLEIAPSDTAVAAGYCAQAQSSPSGVDRIQRALYPFGSVFPVQVCNQTLLAWTMRKFKRFKHRKIAASQFLQRLAQARVDLFAHWRLGMIGVFA